MERRASALSAGSASRVTRPSSSTSTSATLTVRSASMVTTVPPRMASAAGDDALTATVGRAGIWRQQQGDVVVRGVRVDAKFYRHALQKWRGSSAGGEVRGDVEHQAVGVRI